MTEFDLEGLFIGAIVLVGGAAAALALNFLGAWMGAPEFARCFELWGFWDGLDFCL